MITIDPTTPQLKAIKALADAISSRDINNAEPLLSKDWTFRTFPKIPELPDVRKEEYLQKYKAVFAVFAKIELTFFEVIEAPGKVVTQHSFLFTAKDGTTLTYDGVSIFSFVDEDGRVKFLDCKEFSDPGHRSAFYAEAAKALEEGAFAA